MEPRLVGGDNWGSGDIHADWRDAEGIIRIPPYVGSDITYAGNSMRTNTSPWDAVPSLMTHSGLGDWTGYGKRPPGRHTNQKVQMSYKYRRIPTGRISGPYSKELKFHDVAVDLSTLATAGIIFPTVNAIAEGITEKQRIGRQIHVKSINWRYVLTLPRLFESATTAEGDIIRCILFLDNQCNGAAANVTDILEKAEYQAFNNLANKDRFHILYDQTHDMNLIGFSKRLGEVWTTPIVSRHFAMYKKMDTTIEFSGIAGTIGTICCKNYGMLFISRNGIVDIDSEVRVRYNDVS